MLWCDSCCDVTHWETWFICVVVCVCCIWLILWRDSFCDVNHAVTWLILRRASWLMEHTNCLIHQLPRMRRESLCVAVCDSFCNETLFVTWLILRRDSWLVMYYASWQSYKRLTSHLHEPPAYMAHAALAWLVLCTNRKSTFATHSWRD